MEGALPGSVEGFFVSGGTVPLESPSYVARGADAALFEALFAGRFCYVLNSRQMGKSSLCVRTMARLQAAGARTAFVDLTKIGGRNVTPDQWYAGLVVEVGRALGLRAEMLRNWQEEQALSPMQRFFSALRDVALEKVDSQIVIFVDEIDATRRLSFSANEFFPACASRYRARHRDGHVPVHVPRAGARREGGRAIGHLQPGGGALRNDRGQTRRFKGRRPAT